MRKWLASIMLLASLTAYAGNEVRNVEDVNKIKIVSSEKYFNKRLEKKFEKLERTASFYLSGENYLMFDEKEREKVAKKGFGAVAEVYLNEIPIIKKINDGITWLDERIQIRTGNLSLKPLVAEGIGGGLEYKIDKNSKLRLNYFFNNGYEGEFSYSPKKDMNLRIKVGKEEDYKAEIKFGFKW